MVCACAFRWSSIVVIGLLSVAAAVVIGADRLGANEACHICTPPATAPSNGVAVVELFTSEGCSSCPPADRVLSKMVADARANHRQIYPLAFHVDYWNHLGWADRFSSADFSNRQKDYGDALHLRQIYTPQMIINGGAEFVGSDSARAVREVEHALSVSPTAAVQLTVKVDHQQIHVDYTTEHADNQSISFALVERGLDTQVQRGENAGEHLQHDNVVRVFKTATAQPAGQIDLEAAKPLKLENCSVIAFISDPDTRAITGAAAVDLPAATMP